MAKDSFLNLTGVGAIMAGVLMLALLFSLVFGMDGMGGLGRGRAATAMFWLSLLAIALVAVYVAEQLGG
jgi:hypothetical protein